MNKIWVLKRSDGLVKKSEKIKWVNWNNDGTFKNESEIITINSSLLMSPFNQFYTWLTTPIIEIISNDGIIEFKTKNSNYTLEFID